MNSTSEQPSSSSTAVLAPTSVQADTNTVSPMKTRFLTMDIKSSKALAKSVPVIKKDGAKPMIPTHIRASSNNPRAALLAMQAYRRMSGKQQQDEHDKWKGLAPCEQRRFTKVLNDLEKLKENILTGAVSWKEVAPSIETMIKNAPRAARKRPATQSDQPVKKLKINKKRSSIRATIGWTSGASKGTTLGQQVSGSREQVIEHHETAPLLRQTPV